MKRNRLNADETLPTGQYQEATPAMKPLVTNPRCTYGKAKACGSCHYCRLHKDGPLYWLKVGK